MRLAFFKQIWPISYQCRNLLNVYFFKRKQRKRYETIEITVLPQQAQALSYFPSLFCYVNLLLNGKLAFIGNILRIQKLLFFFACMLAASYDTCRDIRVIQRHTSRGQIQSRPINQNVRHLFTALLKNRFLKNPEPRGVTRTTRCRCTYETYVIA